MSERSNYVGRVTHFTVRPVAAVANRTALSSGVIGAGGTRRASGLA
jgi:hypothetical protein